MENDWDVVRNDRGWERRSRHGHVAHHAVVRLGGSSACLDHRADRRKADPLRPAQNGMPDGIDDVTTGSIGSTGYRGEYTIRKSVLQSSPHTVCVIRDNGVQIGDC